MAGEQLKGYPASSPKSAEIGRRHTCDAGEDINGTDNAFVTLELPKN